MQRAFSRVIRTTTIAVCLCLVALAFYIGTYVFAQNYAIHKASELTAEANLEFVEQNRGLLKSTEITKSDVNPMYFSGDYGEMLEGKRVTFVRYSFQIFGIDFASFVRIYDEDGELIYSIHDNI